MAVTEEPMSAEGDVTHDGPQTDQTGTSTCLAPQRAYPSPIQAESDSSVCSEKPKTGRLGHLKRPLVEETPRSNGLEQKVQQDLAKQSSMQLSPQKRKSTNPTNVEEDTKKTKFDNDVDLQFSESQEIDSNFSKDNRYHKGGLVNNLHGTSYQLKLLMLFVKRASDKGYEFNLGTEVVDAEKFDDVVFMYKKETESGEYKIRFVQVKHRQDALKKKITANDLLKEMGKNDDFSLQKYFSSYCKIKEKPAFSESELKDFILYSNIDFDFADLEKAGIKTKKIEEPDYILDGKLHLGKGTGRYKFDISKEDCTRVYEKLRETSHLHLLAKELAQCISDKKKIELRTDILKRYSGPLSRTVFKMEVKGENEVKTKHAKFRVEFVNDVGLPKVVSNFRKALGSALEKYGDRTLTELTDIEFDVCSNFGKELELHSNPNINNPSEPSEHIAQVNSGEKQGKLSYSTLPNDKIEDDEIDSFIEMIVLAVNQPNEVELDEIITREIGDWSKVNLLDGGLVADSFQRKMFDWFKSKGKDKRKEGVFLNKKDGQRFFEDIKQKVNSLISIGPSLAYCEMLKACGIKFVNNDIFGDLKTFLSTENTSKKVFHLISEEETILSAIKVYGTLEDLKQLEGFAQYQKDDSYIFMCLSELLPPQTQKRVIDSFKSAVSHNLLIIHWDSTGMENGINTNIKGLFDKLFDSLSKADKKIILISKDRANILMERFEDLKYKFEDGASFNGFTITEGSKKELLEKNITAFKGEKISLKLKQLYFKLECNELPSTDQLSQLNIDTKTLVQLFKNEGIEIGSRLLGKSDLEGPYFKLCEQVDTDVLISRLEESGDKFFIISGIDGSEKKKTLIENLETISKKPLIDMRQKQVCELNLKSGQSCTQHIEEIILADSEFKEKKIILADSEFKEKDFKKLCHNNPDENFYWIIRNHNKFMLHSLYYPMFLKRRFKYPKKIVIYDDIKTELLKSDSDNAFFITGVDNLEEVLQLQLYNEEEKGKLQENYRLGNIKIPKGNKLDDKQQTESERQFNEYENEQAEANKFVYWIHVDDKKQISWYDVARNTVSEKDLIANIKDKSSIIIDKPGMGKSTSLTLLSEKMHKSHWVILITLKDWQEIIVNLPKDIDNDVVVKFLSDTNNLNTPLERNLVKYILDKENEGGVKPLLLLFDGFDEIRSYDTKNIGKNKLEGLVKYLKEKTQSTVWITAREHDSDRLKKTLSVFDIKFETLEGDEQKQYFKDFWRNSLALSAENVKLDAIFSDENSKFETYYSELAKVVNNILTGRDRLMGIPLTLRLCAECCRDKFKKFVFSNDSNIQQDFDNMSIWKLYKYFIEGRLEIFVREKTNLSSGLTEVLEGWIKEALMERHGRLAFNDLFGDKETKKLLGIKSPFRGEGTKLSIDSKELSELLSFGIIRSMKKGDYEFLHRTLAEYFASEMIIYMLKCKPQNNEKQNEVMISFLKLNIFKINNKVVHKFVDAMSKEDQGLSEVWTLIVGGDSSENLLGQSEAIHRFTTNTTQNYNIAIEENIDDLLVTVKSSIKWNREGTIFRYVESSWGNKKTCGTVEKLIQKSLIEENSNMLKRILELFTQLFRKTVFVIFNNVLTESRILDVLDHYIILQTKTENGIDKEFLKKICESIWSSVNGRNWQKIIEDKMDSSKTIDVEEFFEGVGAIIENNQIGFHYRVLSLTDEMKRAFNEYFRNQDPCGSSVTAFNRASLFLTPEMAVVYNNNIQAEDGSVNGYHHLVFDRLISPLLSFKYFSKYNDSLFTEIDTCALVNMFQAFGAVKGRRKLTLSQRSLEGLIECIRYLVRRDNISVENFTVSMSALISLKNWDFRLVYKSDCLSLHHNSTKENGYLLKLPHEEEIANLLKSRLECNSPLEQECLFKQECKKIVSNIKTRTESIVDHIQESTSRIQDNQNIVAKSVPLDRNYDFGNQDIQPYKSTRQITKTLEAATQQGDYQYWLSDQDIRRIAHLDDTYSKMFHVHALNDLYGTSDRGLVLVSTEELDDQISQMTCNVKNGRIIQQQQQEIPIRRTFIINQEGNHWTTLVIAYKCDTYCGYYVDSLGGLTSQSIRDILSRHDIIVTDFHVSKQQTDGHNCAIWALDNARDINTMLQEHLDTTWLQSQLLPERLNRHEGKYFIDKRKEFSLLLVKSRPESSVQQDVGSLEHKPQESLAPLTSSSSTSS